MSNSLTTFEPSDNAGRKKIVAEISKIEAELRPIIERLNVFFATKILPPAPEPAQPKFDINNDADCLRRRNALHKKKSILGKKQAKNPESLVISVQIQAIKDELDAINQRLKK